MLSALRQLLSLSPEWLHQHSKSTLSSPIDPSIGSPTAPQEDSLLAASRHKFDGQQNSFPIELRRDPNVLFGGRPTEVERMPSPKRRQDRGGSTESHQSLLRTLFQGSRPPWQTPVAALPNASPASLTGVGTRFNAFANAPQHEGASSPSNVAVGQVPAQDISATLGPTIRGIPQCPQCPGASLSSHSASRRHMKKHAPNPPQHCCPAPGCKRNGKIFERKDTLKRHLDTCPAMKRLQVSKDAPPFAHTVHDQPRATSPAQSGHGVEDLERTMNRTPQIEGSQAHAEDLEDLETCRWSQRAAGAQRAKALTEFNRWNAMYDAWTPHIRALEARSGATSDMEAHD